MRRITRTCYWLVGALIAALAGVALATPTTAKAAVTTDVNGNILTVTSDQEADTITLAAAGGVITVNRQATALVADDNAKIVVNAGDGADTVDASALAAPTTRRSPSTAAMGTTCSRAAPTTTTCSATAATTASSASRAMTTSRAVTATTCSSGTTATTTTSWTATRGRTRSRSTAPRPSGDIFTAAPNAGRVLFTRTNLVPFTVDFSAERLTVNGLGGDDTFNGAAGLAPLTLLALNGGTGDDSLSGGDGPDLISGGDGNDKLDGDAGDDRLVGDRGTDTLSGGDGDDALVWNNGDGSDVMNGDAGFERVEINGSPTAGDIFTVRSERRRVPFAARTSCRSRSTSPQRRWRSTVAAATTSSRSRLACRACSSPPTAARATTR